MANDHVTPAPDGLTHGATLQPQEYLQWLLSVERASGLPPDTRAYLVSIDPAEGTRRLTRVGRSDSVINLDADLPKWINQEMVSTDTLKAVAQACKKRLAERGARLELDKDETSAKWALVNADEEANHHGRQLRAIASAIEALLPKDPFQHPLLRMTGDRDADQPRAELRDEIKAAREFATSLHYIGCVMEDSIPDRINEAMELLGMKEEAHA